MASGKTKLVSSVGEAGGKALAKTPLGSALKKLVKNEDELAPVANSRTNGSAYQSSMNRNLTTEQINRKYNVQPSAEYKVYQDELAATRAGNGTTTRAAKEVSTGSKSVSTGNKSLVENTSSPGNQGIKAQATNTGSGKSLLKGTAVTLGVTGLTTAAVVGLPRLFDSLVGEGGSAGDEDNNLLQGDGQWPYSLWGEDPNSTYYVGGSGDPGEPDGTGSSFMAGVADAISQNLPYILIGVGILVIIIAISKKKAKTGKKTTVRKAKKGGSHA